MNQEQLSGYFHYAVYANLILLGMLMVVPGLMKLRDPGSVVAMLSGQGYPAPLVFAWILILSELFSGSAILLRRALHYAVIPPIVILTIAAFTVYWGVWISMLLHLVAVSAYSLVGFHAWIGRLAQAEAS